MPRRARHAAPASILLASGLVCSSLLAGACGASRTPATTRAQTTGPSEARLLMVASESSGAVGTTPEAIARWRPSIDLPASEGRCVRRAMPEPGVQALTVPSTNADGSSNTTTVMVDAANRVIRYSDARGTPRVLITDSTLTPTQRDSAVRAQLGDGPRTIIALDYITGSANATNRELVPGALASVRGSTAQFDTLPAMGPPSERTIAILARCADA